MQMRPKVWWVLSIAFLAFLAVMPGHAQTFNYGTYSVYDTTSGNVIDAGWYPCCSDNILHEYSYNGGNNQLWSFQSNGHICSVGTGLCFQDSGQTLVQVSGGDTFTVTPSGSNFTIKDNQTGRYVNYSTCTGQSCNVWLNSTPYPWNIPAAGGGGTTTIDDRDPAVIYSRGNASAVDWHLYGTCLDDYGCTEDSSNFERSGGPTFQGSSMTISFNGTGITWIGKVGSNYGDAAWSIDGGAPTTFHGYSAQSKNQNPNVVSPTLSSGSHVLQIANLASLTPPSTDHWVTVDAFVISGSALPQSSGTVQSAVNATKVGAWQCGTGNSQDLSNGHCWTTSANSTMSWTFTGSLIEVYGRPDLEDGYLQVYIDNTLKSTIDMNFGNVDDDALNAVMLYAAKLSSGTHTVQLVATGTHDSSATNSFVQIDEFVAYP
jgi:hypothetical protein